MLFALDLTIRKREGKNMISNYLEAPKFIIEMLRKEYCTKTGELDLKKINPDTKLEAYETFWKETSIGFDTYGVVPLSIFYMLCFNHPDEQMSYHYYNHDAMGDDMTYINQKGEVVEDPEYLAILEEEMKMFMDIDE